MKALRKRRGITLVALIVTIIVLLILAGVSIQLIGGSNGILNRASSALDANDKAAATEKMELKITYLHMVSYGENTRKATLQELADGLFADKDVEYVKLKNQEVAGLEPIDVSGESSFFVKLKEYAYEFEIDENLQLASVDGEGVKNENTANSELQQTIEQMKTQLAGLEEKHEKEIAELTSEMESMKSNFEVTKNEMNAKIENLASKTLTSDVLFSGTAGTDGGEHVISNIAGYKYLVVYTDFIYEGKRAGITTNVISVSNITYNNSTTWKANTIFSNSYGNTDSSMQVDYWFKSPTRFRIFTSYCEGGYSNARIFRIEGIK